MQYVEVYRDRESNGKQKGSGQSVSQEPAHGVSCHAMRSHLAGGAAGPEGALPATGNTQRGIGDEAIINNWLEKDDECALIAIVTHVSTSSTDEVDRLDAALLSLSASNLSKEARRRLIKFYAFFKIAEMRRYQEFRGFPQ